MAKKKNGVMNAFIEKYKKLPVKNRIGLIKGLSLNNICLTKSNKGTCEHKQTKVA